MIITELLTLVLMILVLAALRFGIPMLVMFLIKLGCCRVLHLDQP